MSIPAAFFEHVPPVFMGKPGLYMATLASFLLVSLLCLEWIWRLIWSMIERPAKWREPAHAARTIHLLLVVSIFFRVTPYLVLLMAWPDMSPPHRLLLSQVETACRDVSLIPFAIAWLFADLSGAMITYQLRREPIPLHLWPTWQQAKRPLKIGLGVTAIAFALTYLR